MRSRAVKATLAMVPVLAVAGGVLWLMYAPKGYRYEFEVASRAALDGAPAEEQHWRGIGGDRAGGGLFLKADESAIATESAGVMPLLADTSKWVRDHSSFREHRRIEVVSENVDVLGRATQQRLITSDDTLYVDAAPREVVVSVGDSGDVVVGATASGEAVAATGATVRVGKKTITRTHVRHPEDRERRLARTTHTETYVWTTDELDPRVGRDFERFADSLVMLASHRTPRAIRSKHHGLRDGPFRGVALRVVSTAVTVDSLGRRREIVTRAEITSLHKDRNPVAWVRRRKVEALDRRLGAAPGEAAPVPVAPVVPAAPPAAVSPVAAPARPAAVATP